MALHPVSASSSAEGRLVAATHHGLACILIAAEGAGENRRLLQDMVELIRLARVRAPQLPIFALGEQITIENAPAEAMADLNQLRGILYLYEDTVPFLARQVMRAAEDYLDGPAAAVLQGAGAACRALGLLVAHAGARRRRGLPQVAGGLCAARVLRREHPALGPVDLGARSWARCSTTPAR